MHGLGRRIVVTGLAAMVAVLRTGRVEASPAFSDIEAYRDAFQAMPPRSPAQRPLDRVEAAAMAASNRERTAQQAAALPEDAILTAIARFYAQALADGAPFSHTDAQGRQAGERVALLHRRLVGVTAENLYGASLFNPAQAEKAGTEAVRHLMGSPGHRRNLLDTRWTHAGMGAALGRTGLVIVQLFTAQAGLLLTEMPLVLTAGTPMPAGCQQAAAGGFDGVALVPAGRNPQASDFTSPGMLATPTEAGLYQAFYAHADQEMTNESGRSVIFSLHPGPLVQVTAP